MPQILAAAHSYSARPRIPASSRLTSSRSALHSSSAGHRMNARAGRSRSTEPCASSLRCASCTCLGRNGPSSPHSSITSLPAPGRQRRRLRLGGGGVWWWWCGGAGRGEAPGAHPSPPARPPASSRRPAPRWRPCRCRPAFRCQRPGPAARRVVAQLRRRRRAGRGAGGARTLFSLARAKADRRNFS